MVRLRDVLVTCLFASQIAHGYVDLPAEIPPPMVPVPSECRDLMDLFIVIDGSDSISNSNFKILKEAIASLLPQIRLGERQARIGMLVYSSHIPLDSEHAFSADFNFLLNSAMTLSHPRDGTNTALGIEHMRAMFKKYGRPRVPWVCVVITDGISKDSKATAMQANLAKEMGISMLAVGITKRINQAELVAIADTPKQVIKLDVFAELQPKLAAMMKTICPCPTPPAIPRAECVDGPRAIGTVRTYKCAAGYHRRGNPDIVCRDDSTWSPLDPNFECASCGATPVMLHAHCDGVDDLIGARRVYTCDPRYALIGDPNIECQRGATWSKPKFTCSPCGNTPPMNLATCTGNGHFVGDKRKYECDPRYALIGDPFIQCQPDGQWSMPTFSCNLCGDPEPVQHGRCKGGDYFVDTVREYECDRGYALIGDPFIRCLSTGQWSPAQLSCSLCGPTPPIDHGRCGGKDHFVDTVREYTCDTGYALIGDPFIRCQSNGQWSDLHASCRLCGPTPLIDHGRCSGKDHFVDTVREYTCDDGYAMIGDPFIRCQRDGQWSAVQASCGRVCGPTPPIDNGLCGGSGYFVNTVREYTCTTGYALIGDPFIRCEPDGRWSPVQVSCSLCGSTPPIDHGRCGGGDHFVNTERIYECDTGYALIGNPIIRCEPNGQWSALQASCSLCGPTPPIDHGQCGVGDHFVNTERIYECDQGYALIGDPIIRCQSNGLWSDLRASCSLCGPTPPLEHGRCGGKDHFVDTVREYTCETGYALIGDPFIRCQNNGQWSDLRASCRLCGPTPLLDHGRCTGKDHFVDTIREYICDDGYAVIGDPYIRCQRDGQWSAVQASCGRVCGPTPPIDNGLCGGSGYFVNTVREYTCTTGYALIGDPFIRCEPDGRWSPVQVSCSLCGPTPPIDHGRCGGGDHFVNTERIYECDKGYALIGDPIIRCEADGQWSALQASCRLCGPTPPIDHGSCTGIDHFVDTVREYTCHEGYALIGDPFIRCLPNGQWSPVQVSCRLCGRTPPLDHGRCGPGGHTVDTVRQYECSNGYAMVGDPYIRCLANGQWSNILGSCHLSCGDPLPIDYGTCDGVDHIVNSVRRYQCDSRYAMIGDPTITCQPNGQWSKVMVSCRPCEEPPVIDNADCGPGGYFVGDRRTYKCKDGYSHFGNLDIKCLPDGMWSHTDLQCKVTECGNPPFVPNAYPKLGSSLIGKHREYYCDIGHRMRGYGRITCLSNGQWENPKFSCEVVTTPKPTTPAPVPSEPSVCDQCRFENGVGYDSHPYDCNQYIQCFSGNNGYLPIYRRCPFGLHWDQKNLTCNYPELAYCKNDRCATGSIYGYKPEEDPNNCCSYWKCNNGVSKGACCGKGMTFNPKTGQCQLDHSCTSPCLYEEELPGCDKRPILDETKFEQHIGKGNWARMDCAPGTAFNPVDCRCSVHLMTIPGKVRQVCKPVVNMPFHFDTKDYSGQNVYVRNDGVTVRNGAAYFDGNSRLMIPRFTNQQFGGNLVISFRYKEVLNPYTLDQLQALVSNGDCGSDPSIIISKIPEYVILAAKTRTLRTLPIPTVNKIWKEVVFMHDESYLEGKVCGGRAYTSSAGPIQATHCALQIGYGQGLSNFVGYIDNFKIYQCRPRHL